MKSLERMPSPPPISDDDRPTGRIPVSAQMRIAHKRDVAAERVGRPLYESVSKVVPKSHRSERTGREEFYTPTLIAQGGEHLVFEFENPEHEDVVYKVNFYKTLPVLYAALRGPKQLEEGKRYLKEDIEEQQSKMRELRRYFGHDAVPVQRYMVRDVPISKDVVQALSPHLKEYDGPLPEKIPAWVTVQRRLELDPRTSFSLNGYYPEKAMKAYIEANTDYFKNPDAYEELYDAAHDVLMGYLPPGSAELDEQERQSLALIMFPDLFPLASKIASEPEVKTRLQEIVRRMIAYTEETGNAMDLAGRNNVAMLSEGGTWKLKMPDPLHAETVPMLGDVSATARLLAENKYVPQGLAGKAMNALNTVRVINALALLAGIPERIDVQDSLMVEPKKWRETFTPILEQF